MASTVACITIRLLNIACGSIPSANFCQALLQVSYHCILVFLVLDRKFSQTRYSQHLDSATAESDCARLIAYDFSACDTKKSLQAQCHE